MTDIDAIRKKHEAYKKWITDNYGSDRLMHTPGLTISDVDALFRELDEYHTLCQGHVLAQKQWKAALDEARGKVGRIEKLIRHAFDLPDVKWSTPAYTYVSKKLEQILKGGGK